MNLNLFNSRNDNESILSYSQSIFMSFIDETINKRYLNYTNNFMVTPMSILLTVIILVLDPRVLFIPILGFFFKKPGVIRFLHFTSLLLVDISFGCVLDFASHYLTHRPWTEYAIYAFIRLCVKNWSQDSCIFEIIATIILLLIEKDKKDFWVIQDHFKHEFSRETSINENLSTGILVIDDTGKILKKNLKTLKLFKNSESSHHINDLFSGHYINRINMMVKVASLKRIHEENFSFNLSNIGWVQILVSAKSVPFNEKNAFLLNFTDANLSAKKRKFVVNSYKSNYASLENIEFIFLKRYKNTKILTLNDLIILLNYMYHQKESIYITELVIGESHTNQMNFDVKSETINTIQQIWSGYESKSIKINLLFEQEIPIVLGDKVIHDLILRGILDYIRLVSIEKIELLIIVSMKVIFI